MDLRFPSSNRKSLRKESLKLCKHEKPVTSSAIFKLESTQYINNKLCIYPRSFFLRLIFPCCVFTIFTKHKSRCVYRESQVKNVFIIIFLLSGKPQNTKSPPPPKKKRNLQNALLNVSKSHRSGFKLVISLDLHP